jgi:hypothetical protein
LGETKSPDSGHMRGRTLAAAGLAHPDRFVAFGTQWRVRPKRMCTIPLANARARLLLSPNPETSRAKRGIPDKTLEGGVDIVPTTLLTAYLEAL